MSAAMTVITPHLWGACCHNVSTIHDGEGEPNSIMCLPCFHISGMEYHQTAEGLKAYRNRYRSLAVYDILSLLLKFFWSDSYSIRLPFIHYKSELQGNNNYAGL